jgi:hypothetical protein
MEVLALLGLAYVSTILNTQIISEHEKEANKKENFISFPFFKQINKDQSNTKQTDNKKDRKKAEKKKECNTSYNNYIQYPVKLDNYVGKITPLDDYYKFNKNRRTASKYPIANGLNIEYDQTWAPIKEGDMTYGVLNKGKFNQY